MNHRSGYRVGESVHRTGVTVEPCQWETSQQNSTGSSLNLDRSTTRFGNRQTTLRRHKLVVVLSSTVTFWRQLQIYNLCGKLAQAVEFVWQRDRFVGRVHVKRPLCTFCLQSQPGLWSTSPRKPLSSSHQVVRNTVKLTHHPRCKTVVFCTMTLHKEGNTHLFPIEISPVRSRRTHLLKLVFCGRNAKLQQLTRGKL